MDKEELEIFKQSGNAFNVACELSRSIGKENHLIYFVLHAIKGKQLKWLKKN